MCLQPVLPDLDGVLVMSVNPGFAKQKFLPVAIPKIQQLRAVFSGDISVDGGVTELTSKEAVKAGANILVSASYFFGADDPRSVVRAMQSL